jgi:hypothetical protein
MFLEDSLFLRESVLLTKIPPTPRSSARAPGVVGWESEVERDREGPLQVFLTGATGYIGGAVAEE